MLTMYRTSRQHHNAAAKQEAQQEIVPLEVGASNHRVSALGFLVTPEPLRDAGAVQTRRSRR